ncbi:unnamed protein product [Nyctereutes procyonoides]|uniref:(raccoon dog) hypothetical protein n=1 Tax=Nyctereutes procyonoides TaxID=34880 RepID=A0A811YVD6_NYCPR|nr:unnamed protein product [Nyctereutes procyonoides]
MKKVGRVVIEKQYMPLGIDSTPTSTRVRRPRHSPAGNSTTEQAVTGQMEQIQRGPVRGVSIKPQEEEGESPGSGDQEGRPDTEEMLRVSDFGGLSKRQVTQPRVETNFRTPHGAI